VKNIIESPAIIRSVDAMAELADRINAEHHQVETALRAGLQHAKNAGDLLIAAKKQCEHGAWLPWLEKHVRFSERTAQAYMRVSKRWPELEAKAQATADLTIEDGLKLLAAPKTDEVTAGTPAPAESLYPLPAFSSGERYVAYGRTRRFRAVVEIDPHPDHPGYWVLTCYTSEPGENAGGIADYIGRGMRLDLDGVLDHILSACEFRQASEWIAEPASTCGVPYAVQMYRQDWRYQLSEVQPR
jgi:hypothetical protein